MYSIATDGADVVCAEEPHYRTENLGRQRRRRRGDTGSGARRAAEPIHGGGILRGSRRKSADVPGLPARPGATRLLGMAPRTETSTAGGCRETAYARGLDTSRRNRFPNDGCKGSAHQRPGEDQALSRSQGVRRNLDTYGFRRTPWDLDKA